MAQDDATTLLKDSESKRIHRVSTKDNSDQPLKNIKICKNSQFFPIIQVKYFL